MSLEYLGIFHIQASDLLEC